MYPSGYDKYNILIALLLFGTAYIIDINAQPKVYFHDKMIEGNLFSIVALALISVTAILMLCKAIKRIPVISSLDDIQSFRYVYTTLFIVR